MSEAPAVRTPTVVSGSNLGRDCRARAWAFAFECYRKKAVPDRRPDDVERTSDEIDATASIQRTA